MLHIEFKYPAWQFLLLFPMALCACAGDEANTPTPSGNDTPVSFSASDKWNNDETRLVEDDKTTSFSAGDNIGVFAYKGTSQTPDFMNNQRVTYDGSAWSYSPIKYWPQNEGLSFYAYYPWRESTDGSTIKAESSSDNKLTINYCCPNANIDLMASDKNEDQKLSTNKGQTSFSFQHLLARVRFSFTYEGTDRYRPVVHMLKYTISRYKAIVTCYSNEQSSASNNTYTSASGLFTYTWSDVTPSDEAIEVVRYVNDVAGVVIAKENQCIDEFTAYLLPCEFPYSENAEAKLGRFVFSLNNVTYYYMPDGLISVKPGKSYTINFKIKANSSESGNYFITSYSIWADGGTINGTLE